MLKKARISEIWSVLRSQSKSDVQSADCTTSKVETQAHN